MQLFGNHPRGCQRKRRYRCIHERRRLIGVVFKIISQQQREHSADQDIQSVFSKSPRSDCNRFGIGFSPIDPSHNSHQKIECLQDRFQVQLRKKANVDVKTRCNQRKGPTPNRSKRSQNYIENTRQNSNPFDPRCNKNSFPKRMQSILHAY